MGLGMIGLGRMATNMVRRLRRAGHQCVVYDLQPEVVDVLAKEGAVGTTSLGDFAKKLKKPLAVWMMVPAAVVDSVLKTHHPVRPYKRHGWGPKEADILIAADGCWHNPKPKQGAG